MADELVQINNNKENILEFDLTVEGLDANSVDAKFVIRSNGMDLAFKCERDTMGKWSVKLPALPMLERTAYPCEFQVVAEGYAFTPYKGAINVVGSNDVYISQPKSKYSSPIAQQKVEETVKPVEIPKVLPTKGREKGIAQIAAELMESHKKETSVASPTVAADTTVPVTTSTVIVKENLLPKIDVTPKPDDKGKKDEAARKVLESIGIKVKKQPKKRFSLK